MTTKILDIAKVIQATGLPASTLRFYEQKGLIKSAGRKGLRRQYSANIVERLGLISLARTAGFSLTEITHMLSEETPDLDRQQLLNKADEIDQKIKQLSAIRDGLHHAANCPAPSHLECPTFQRLLKLANKKRVKNE